MKTRPTKTLKTIANRTVAVLMCTCMIGSSVPTTAFAAEPKVSEGEQSGNGLCDHHTAHDSSCGYSEATQEHECNHTHTEECGESCTHTHNEECGYSEGMAGSPCTYVCGECNGGNDNDNDNDNDGENNSPVNENENNTDTGNDDDTTGDTENDAADTDNEDDEEDVCTCTEACTEESVNGECPVCKVGGGV